MSRLMRTSVLLILHVALILLAASSFTLVSWMWSSGDPLSFNFFQFAQRGGWGRPYVSDYSLPQVLTYVLGYAIGLVAYWQLRPFRQRLIVGCGTLVCLIGLGSFALELSHWAFDHHTSLVVNAPAIAVAIGLLGLVQLGRGLTAQVQRAPSPAHPV